MGGYSGSRMTPEYLAQIAQKRSAAQLDRSAYRCIRLNGSRMGTVEKAHAYMARKFQFPFYYGRNLDALYDILSTVGEPTLLLLFNKARMCDRLGDYAPRLLQVFADASQANVNFRLEEYD